MSKYFTVEVTPTVTASKQHTAAFTGGDVLFDWTEVQIPKGTSKVIGATMLVRAKGNSAVTANIFGSNLIFSKTDTQTLGTINSTPDQVPSNDLLGFIDLDDTHQSIASTLKSTAIGMATRNSANGSTFPNLLITPTQEGTNVGYDKFYIGGIADGAFDFRTIVRINDGDIDTASPGTTLATDGASMDIRKHFIAGDVLHAHDDAVIGTVASVTDATDLELTAALSTGVLEDDDYVYNINPIKIILFFEQ